MTPDSGQDIPARFRRQMRAAAVQRWVLGTTLVVGLIACHFVGTPTRGWVVAGLAGVAGLWIALALRGVKQVHATRTSSALLAAGRIADARQALVATLNRMTPLSSVKILACHYLAVAAHLSRSYAEAAAICRELLSHRLGQMKNIAAATRLILADALLMLDESNAAAAAIQAIDPNALSLTERLTLLPIELRCQLATGRAERAVESLPEKVRLAELLDTTNAALTHMLLAEACRRMELADKQRYLLERAALLAELNPIVARFKPLLAELDTTAATEPTGPTDSDR